MFDMFYSLINLTVINPSSWSIQDLTKETSSCAIKKKICFIK